MRALITAYTFSASTGEVTFTALADPLEKVRVLGIWNDTDGIKLYDPHTTGYNGSVSGNILKLDVDTSAMSNGDDLLIFYELDTLQDVLKQLVAIHGHTQSIDGKTPALDAGQVPVLDAGSAALLFDILGYITNVDSKLAALGPAFKIGSMPVTLSPDDPAVVALGEVQASPTPNTVLDRLKTIATSLSTAATTARQDIGNSAIATGNTIAIANGVLVGAVNETAPASDTASSGLNGRLQRIAQRLTTLITNIGTHVFGAGTEAAALRVTLPTDGTGKVNAAQSGTWTVQPGNTPNTTAWKVDNSAVTQPTKIAYQTTKALTNAAITLASSGENTMVSGTASQTIRVFKIVLTAASAVGISFKDAAGGTSLTGVMTVGTNGSIVLESNDGEPLFVSATAGAFILNLSAAVSVTGFIQYTKS